MRNDIAEMANDLERALELGDFTAARRIDKELERHVSQVLTTIGPDDEWQAIGEYVSLLHNSLRRWEIAQVLSYVSMLARLAARIDTRVHPTPPAAVTTHAAIMLACHETLW